MTTTYTIDVELTQDEADLYLEFHYAPIRLDLKTNRRRRIGYEQVINKVDDKLLRAIGIEDLDA